MKNSLKSSLFLFVREVIQLLREMIWLCVSYIVFIEWLITIVTYALYNF